MKEKRGTRNPLWLFLLKLKTLIQQHSYSPDGVYNIPDKIIVNPKLSRRGIHLSSRYLLKTYTNKNVILQTQTYMTPGCLNSLLS